MDDPLPALVLDTNVVLDWLVFRDASCAVLAAAIEAGRVRWLATPAMRDELAAVLARGGFERWSPDLDAVLAGWDRHVVPAEPAPPAPGWACSDPDDQKFLDLAVHARATSLLTRDRALLAFTRRAQPSGLWIGRPADWISPPPG
jgi:predicted nucleic acid-binding protein